MCIGRFLGAALAPRLKDNAVPAGSWPGGWQDVGAGTAETAEARYN